MQSRYSIIFRIALLVLIAITTPTLLISAPFVLVLDAGHGGHDAGAANGRAREKDINLNVTLRVGELIEKNCKDVKVIYTRTNDKFVELYKRADIANKANADLFISIHTNAAKNSSANGVETYLLGVEEKRTNANLNVAIEENKAILLESDYETHYAGYDPNSPESQIIFEFMQNEYQKESLSIASYVQNELVNICKLANRGVHQAGYLVLWKSAMPSILIELGFISNSNEMRYMTSAKGVEDMSQSIYRAFCSYLSDVRKQEQKQKELQKSETSNSVVTSLPIYKVQFLTSRTKLEPSDRRLKGLSNVEIIEENGLYKYFCGATNSYDEIQQIKKSVLKSYKDAFVVAYIDNRKISISEARAYKSKR